jgi:YD repeat-containing protein
MTDPLNRTTTYAYDALDRRTQVRDAANGTMEKLADALGVEPEDIDDFAPSFRPCHRPPGSTVSSRRLDAVPATPSSSRSPDPLPADPREFANRIA